MKILFTVLALLGTILFALLWGVNVKSAEAATVLFPVGGGTGWGAPGGIQTGAIPYGQGLNRFATTTQGTGGYVLSWLNGIPTWTATSSIQNLILTTTGSSGAATLNGFTLNIPQYTSGGGGSGTVSTSSSETGTYIPFWTSTSGTPAELSGGDSGFTWNNTDKRLTATYASSTAVSATHADFSTLNITSLGVGALYTNSAGAVFTHATSSSSVAYQDVWRDGNANAYANNFIPNLTSTVSSGGTVVLTPASARYQLLTGSAVHTFQMPNGNAAGMSTGATWEFNNDSTGVMHVQTHGGAFIADVPSGGFDKVILTDNGTSEGSWETHALLGHQNVSGTAALGLGTSTPYAQLSIHANNAGSPIYNTLLAVGSSTASATSTLFSVNNIGSTTLFQIPSSVLYTNSNSTVVGTPFSTAGFILALANGVPTWVGTTTAGTGLTYNAGSPGNFSVNTSQNIATLSNLTSNGFVKTSGGNGTLSVDTTTYLSAYDAWTHASIGSSATTSAIGIGTTTPFSQLSVSTSTQSAITTPLFAVASTTNATLFNVLGGGNVGVGTTSPGTLFGINGSANFTTATSTILGNGLSVPNLTITGLSAGKLVGIGAGGYAQNATVSTGLTYTGGNLTVNTSQNIATLSNLTSNGAILTSGGVGTLGIYAGTSCTNQFVRSLSGSIAATCATVGAADVSLANLTATDSTLTFSGTYNGSTARTIGINLANANTWTALQTFSGNASTTRLTVSNNAVATSTWLSGGVNIYKSLGIGGTSTTTITGDAGTSTFSGGINVNGTNVYNNTGTSTIQQTSGLKIWNGSHGLNVVPGTSTTTLEFF